MNNFSRDELLTFRLDMNFNIVNAQASGKKVSNRYRALRDKLQSMIDNYQEPCPSAHEFYEMLVCEDCFGHTQRKLNELRDKDE